MPLSEHVYCAALKFKMTEQVGQRICNKFCVKLQSFSVETMQMIQKAAVMGNWWLAASSQQCARSCITSQVQSFLAKYQITQVTQPPYSPDLATCDFWLFPKLKSPSRGKRFQTISDIQENTTGLLMAIGRTVWGPKVPTLKGTEVSLSYVQYFLYLVSLINVPSFPITWLDTFWTDLYVIDIYIYVSIYLSTYLYIYHTYTYVYMYVYIYTYTHTASTIVCIK